FHRLIAVGVVPVLAPLADIAVHVIQTPGIRREASHRRRPFPVDPLLATPVGTGASVADLVRANRFSPEERRGGAGPASILPLRLGRQVVRLAITLPQLSEKVLAVPPGHAFHREVLVLEVAGV